MSQAEGTSEKFGSRTFTVYRFPPKVARRHIAKLAKILGPSLGGVMEAGAKQHAQGGDANEADVPIGKLIADALERLEVDYVEELMDLCAEYTQCEPGGQLSTVYDAVFLNAPLDQFKWWWFALKVQFGDFFPGLVDGSNPILQAIQGGAPDQQSPNTSTG